MDRFYRKEMSEYLGVAQNSLIYLEKKNFIPTYRQSNGYRYYRGDSVSRLLLYRYLRSYGYNIDEAVEVFHSKTNAEILQRLQTQAANLEQEILSLQYQLAMLQKNISVFDSIPEHELHLERGTMPKLYLLRDGDSQVKRQWIAAMPVVRPCFLEPLPEEHRAFLDYDFGYCVLEEDLCTTGLSLELSGCELYAFGQTVFHGYLPVQEDADRNSPVETFLEQQGLRQTQPILYCMTEKRCLDTGVHVLEVWVPYTE